MKESDVLKACMKAISGLGHTIFRNNVGVLKDRRGTPVRYGLCVGSSDLIGFTKVEITHNMVGKQVPIFTAIEVKTDKGTVSEKQKKFLSFMRKNNCVSGVARSKEEAESIINAYKEKMRGL